MECNCKKCNGNKFAVYTKDNGCVFGVCVQCGTETEEEYISAKDYFNKIVLEKNDLM